MEKKALTIRTCRRCSVTRVNTLCELYDQAVNHQDQQALSHLRQLVHLAVERGYADGTLLTPGLTTEEARAQSWNVSSVLTDEDLERLGLGDGHLR